MWIRLCVCRCVFVDVWISVYLRPSLFLFLSVVVCVCICLCPCSLSVCLSGSFPKGLTAISLVCLRACRHAVAASQINYCISVWGLWQSLGFSHFLSRQNVFITVTIIIPSIIISVMIIIIIIIIFQLSLSLPWGFMIIFIDSNVINTFPLLAWWILKCSLRLLQNPR